MADATPINTPEAEQPAPQKQTKQKAQQVQQEAAPKGVQLETHDAVRVDH